MGECVHESDKINTSLLISKSTNRYFSLLHKIPYGIIYFLRFPFYQPHYTDCPRECACELKFPFKEQLGSTVWCFHY